MGEGNHKIKLVEKVRTKKVKPICDLTFFNIYY